MSLNLEPLQVEFNIINFLEMSCSDSQILVFVGEEREALPTNQNQSKQLSMLTLL